jgi:hypothetical protein
MDLIARYDPAQLPAELTAYVANRTGYDYHHHAEVGSDNASFVSDEVVDAFNIYLMSGEEEATLEIYGRAVLPALGATPPRARPAAPRAPRAKPTTARS